MYQVKITRPGSLLSVLLDQEITPAQASIIVSVTKAPNLTYSETLAWLANRQRPPTFGPDGRHFSEEYMAYMDGPIEGIDAPVGAGDEVEAYRG